MNFIIVIKYNIYKYYMLSKSFFILLNILIYIIYKYHNNDK